MSHPRRRGGAPVAVIVALLFLAGCGGSGGGDDGAETDDGPDATTSALTPDALPVLVVEAPVPAGTEADAALGQGLLREDVVTRAQFPENAIVSVELIEGMIATTTLQPGTIVLAGMFLPPAATSTSATSPSDGSSASTEAPATTAPSAASSTTAAAVP